MPSCPIWGKQLGALAGPGAELLHLVLGVLHLLAKRGGPLSAAHHVLEIAQTSAGFFRKGVERIETRVHHLQKVLSRQLAGCADLRKRKGKALEFVLVAKRDVPKTVHGRIGIFSVHAKGKHGLRCAGQILHAKGCLGCFFPKLRDILHALCLVPEHDGKVGLVCFHLRVVFDSGNRNIFQSLRQLGKGKRANQLPAQLCQSGG